VTSEGLAYLELRYHLLLSFAMNANFYLLLRAEGGKTDPRQHPVVDRLLALQVYTSTQGRIPKAKMTLLFASLDILVFYASLGASYSGTRPLLF